MKLSDMQGGATARKSQRQLNEGFWSEFGDNIATTFMPGSDTADNAAIRKAKRGGERQARMTYEIGLNNITKTLNDALSSALQAGLISPAQPTYNIKRDPIKGADATDSQADKAADAETKLSPEEIIAQKRKEKQAAATQRARDEMAPFSKLKTPAPQTPEQIRQAKMAAATQRARDEMAPFSKLSPTTQPGERAFGQMASDMEKMANQPKVTTLPPGSRQLGPKGRATLARLGKQKQDRTSGTQQSLDLNEQKLPSKLNNMSYGKFDSLLESLIAEQEEAQQPQQAQQITIGDYIARYVNNMAAQEKIDIGQVDPGFRRLKQLSEIIASKIGNGTVVQLSTSDYKPLWDLYVAAAKLQAAPPGSEGEKTTPKNAKQNPTDKKQPADAGILSTIGVDPTASKADKAKAAKLFVDKLVKALKGDDANIAATLKKAIDDANI